MIAHARLIPRVRLSFVQSCAFAWVSLSGRVPRSSSPSWPCRAFLRKIPYALAPITSECGLRPISKRRFEFLPCYPFPSEFWHKLKRELAGSATFDTLILTLFSTVLFGSRLPIRAEASRVNMNFSKMNRRL